MRYNVPDDYKLGPGEINNIVYLICKHTCGWPMRAADLAVCNMMRDQSASGSQEIQSLIEVTVEYVWDHIMGEPYAPSQEMILQHIQPMLQHWYETTPQADREITD
jgi:hypothetical protein